MSLTLEISFHMHLPKEESFSVLILNLSLRRAREMYATSQLVSTKSQSSTENGLERIEALHILCLVLLT